MTPDSAGAAEHPAQPDQVASLGLAPLDGLDDVDIAEHVPRFERVHDALRARLDGTQSPDHETER